MQHNETQHNNKKCDTKHYDNHNSILSDAFAECRYSECRYADCSGTTILPFNFFHFLKSERNHPNEVTKMSANWN